MQEYQKHIRQTHADRTKLAYCGVKIASFDWAFEGADHLLNNLEAEGRLQGCPACLKALKKILKTSC